MTHATLSGPLGDFAARVDLAARTEPYLPHVWHGDPGGVPRLHVDDVSAIPFLVDITGVEEYQHRARIRAMDGDLYATVTPVHRRYEQYCREALGFGDVTWLDAAGGDNPLAVTRGCLNGPGGALLVDRARTAGGLAIHPYMAIEDVWTLATRLAADAGVPVSVIGPPPPTTWIANDKDLFTELIEIVLGPGWTPETHRATEPARMAKIVRRLAAHHPTVGLKRTRCASAMGNCVLDAGPLREEPPAATEATVRRFLDRTEWSGDEPVLVVAWEDARLSPSTQWWIPPEANGPPRLDGIYEQILEGERKVFVGSRPAKLPPPVRDALTGAAARVARALQQLGYVGRCSFDHLILELDEDEPSAARRATIRFTECNGRWGGTSTPMHLVDRVVDGPRPPYRAQDFTHERLVGLTLDEVLARVGEDLFDRARQRGRFIFYNVGPLAAFGKLDVIALGNTQAEADHALLSDLPHLLQL